MPSRTVDVERWNSLVALLWRCMTSASRSFVPLVNEPTLPALSCRVLTGISSRSLGYALSQCPELGCGLRWPLRKSTIWQPQKRRCRFLISHQVHHTERRRSSATFLLPTNGRGSLQGKPWKPLVVGSGNPPQKYNPELQKRSLANRKEREQEFDAFVTKLKGYSKSSRPSTDRINLRSVHIPPS